MTILISLLRSKKVCSLDDSFCVPVFDPLRFVEVIVILLADFVMKGFISFKCYDGSYAHRAKFA